jgi:hypothetical protein
MGALGYAVFVHVETATPWIAELKEAATGGKPAPAGPTTPTPHPAPPAFARSVPADNASVAAWAIFCSNARSWPSDPERYRRDAILHGGQDPGAEVPGTRRVRAVQGRAQRPRLRIRRRPRSGDIRLRLRPSG